MADSHSPQPHILVLTFPAQSHINPALQLAKRLAAAGAFVTFATSASAIKRMPSPSAATPNISFASLYDGDSIPTDPAVDPAVFLAEFCRLGRISAADIVASFAAEGRPVTCIVYTILLPWAADLARHLGLPSFLFWIQPAALFSIYYRYFDDGYSDQIVSSINAAELINLPGLPPLAKEDLPSFLLPDTPHGFMVTAISNLFEELRKGEGKPRVLANTFDALEKDALEAIAGEVEVTTVGPMIPSAFLDGKNKSDTSFGGDIFSTSPDDDYIRWLGGKDEASIVYISFGSFSVLSKRQMEEIFGAIKESGYRFMWVMRKSEIQEEEAQMEEFRARLCRETEQQGGIVVGWCSQVEVLSHPAVGCFVTHCGWNSTSEGLAAGVPMVCIPQWSDQLTNAKLVQDVWKAGVRAKSDSEGGVVEAGELRRCLEAAMREEVRETVKKWGVAAREAAGEGGSSEKNILAFVERLKRSGRV